MSALAEEFYSIASRLSQRLNTLGTPTKALSPGRRFTDLDEVQQKNSITRIRLQLEQMEKIDPAMSEREKFEFLTHYHNMKAADLSKLGDFDFEQPWEIIDFNLNQLYRNHMVFKLGDYSIEEYETYSPWELYARPKGVVEELMRLTEKLKATKKFMDLRHMEPYVIEAILSPFKSKYKIQHDFAFPLENPDTGENVAFISSFKLEGIDPESTDRVILFS